MQDIDLTAFMAGVEDELLLSKQADLFSMPSGGIFPHTNQQAKWKFAKGEGFLRLHDGQHVYHFDMPKIEEEGPFDATRKPDPQPNEFESGAQSKGLAQVHRSDPGSIYFTLQEGYRNPTYTFSHAGGDRWRVLPKRRKISVTHQQTSGPQVTHSYDLDQVKKGMEMELEKNAEPGMGSNLLGGLLNGVQSTALFPGRNWDTPWLGMSGGLGAAAAGGLGGAAYHFGKKHLYNTEEENAAEAEEGMSLPLKRIGLPALAAGGLSAMQGSLAKNYYRDVSTGNNTHAVVPQ